MKDQDEARLAWKCAQLLDTLQSRLWDNYYEEFLGFIIEGIDQEIRNEASSEENDEQSFMPDPFDPPTEG